MAVEDPVEALLLRAASSGARRCADISVVSPWPIFTVTIERAPEGHDEVYFHAGGQGVWIARMARALGASATLIGPIGGESGRVIRMLVEAEGVALRSVEIAGWNGGYVSDRRSGERREVANMPPPRLTRHEIDDFYNAALSQGLHGATTVITGFAGVDVLPAGALADLVHDLDSNGAQVVADVGGEVLKAMRGGLAMLKVSDKELVEAGLADDDSERAVVDAALRLTENTARAVVVSRAEKGALAVAEGRIREARQPPLTPVDPSGAGDSMTAALAVARATGLGVGDALRLAAAAGAANATRRGRGTGAPQDILERARRVEVVPRDDL